MKEPRVGRLEVAARKIARMHPMAIYRIKPDDVYARECMTEAAILKLARRYAARKLREVLKIVPHCGERPRCWVVAENPDNHEGCGWHEQIKALSKSPKRSGIEPKPRATRRDGGRGKAK